MKSNRNSPRFLSCFTDGGYSDPLFLYMELYRLFRNEYHMSPRSARSAARQEMIVGNHD